MVALSPSSLLTPVRTAGAAPRIPVASALRRFGAPAPAASASGRVEARAPAASMDAALAPVGTKLRGLGASVRARVLEALGKREIPVVQDNELLAAVDALFAHARGHTDLAARHEGNALVSIVDGTEAAKAGPLELFFAPHRHPEAGEAGHKDDGCPFCAPDRELGVLRWRGRHILPNAFPYTPSSSKQLLLIPTEHAGQDFDGAFFADVLALQRALGARTAMHFNGRAGNSQPHLHWHAHEERLPLERRLDAGALPLAPMASRFGAALSSYDDGELRGLLVQGADDAAVAAFAAEVAAALERDPTVAGRFNMLLLRRSGGEARLVIVPRRAAALVTTDAVAGKMSGGALDVAGRRIIESDSAAPGLVDAWRAYLRASTVDVAEIKGLPTEMSGARLSPVGARLRVMCG